MAYEKQSWSNLPNKTTPISAARLNHLETQYDEAVAASSSYTDGEVEALGGAVTARLSELSANVRDFGAVGDGATDDTAAIQAAADSLVGGGTLFFPTGEYVTDGWVRLPSHCTVTGTPDAVLVKLVGSTSYTVFGCTPDSLGWAHNIVIRGIRARGVFPGRGVCLLWAHRVDGVTVADVTVDFASHGGHVFDLMGAKNVLIENSTFRGASHSAADIGECVQLDSSNARGASVTVPGIVFDGTATTHVTVRNCRFEGIESGGSTYPAPRPIGVHSVVEGNWYTDIVFENNYVEAAPLHSGFRDALINFEAVERVRVSGNRFDLGGAAAPAYSAVVTFHSVAWFTPLAEVNNPAAVAVNDPLTPMRGVEVEVAGNSFGTTGVKAWRDWVELPIYDTPNFESWGDNYYTKLRLFMSGATVSLTGTLRCLTAGYLVGATRRKLAVVPPELRPSYDTVATVSSAAGTYLLEVLSSTGEIFASRHTGTHPVNLWMPISAEWRKR